MPGRPIDPTVRSARVGRASSGDEGWQRVQARVVLPVKLSLLLVHCTVLQSYEGDLIAGGKLLLSNKGTRPMHSKTSHSTAFDLLALSTCLTGTGLTEIPKIAQAVLEADLSANFIVR